MQLDGRFTLGVGTGEALNEHVLRDRWPSEDVRLDMLEEAVGEKSFDLALRIGDGFITTQPELLPRLHG